MDANLVLPERWEHELLERACALTASTVDEVAEAVPEYRQFFASARGDSVRQHIEIAVRTFVRLAAQPVGSTASDDLVRTATESAHAIGRGEARAGRGTATVLSALRVGGRSLWAGIAHHSMTQELSGPAVAELAGRLFDFVERISAAVVTGHQEELSGLMRARDRERDALVRAVVAHGRPTSHQSSRAAWAVPSHAVVALARRSETLRLAVDRPGQVLVAAGDLPGIEESEDLSVALVPIVTRSDRVDLLSAAGDRAVVVGPTTRIEQCPSAYAWVVRLWRSVSREALPLDAERFLPTALLGADPELVAMMRKRLLAPLADLPPSTRASLEDTLGSWLRQRGRQDRVAAELFVHVQTVRYRLGRLRTLLGDTIDDPDLTLELLLCLTASGASSEPEP